MSDIFPSANVSTENGVDLQSTTTLSVPTEKLVLPDALFDSNVTPFEPFLPSMHPLIVYETNGVYHIIDGCRRFLCAVQKKQTHCLCIILTGIKNSCDAHILRITLNSNRPLSFREKFLFLKWLKNNSSDEFYNSTAAKFPFSQNERREIEQIFDISDKMLDQIEKSHVDLNVIPELLLLDKPAQSILLHFFSQLQFSRSFQREFIEWIPEIAFRKSCTIAEVIESPQISEILHHKSMNPPQKMQKIKDFLFRERFPVLAEAKSAWTELARKLNPDPAHLQFLPSDSFEKNRLELKITISNPDEILSIFEKLKIITSEQWSKLIYPAKNFDPEM
jgi:hypothetical protein